VSATLATGTHADTRDGFYRAVRAVGRFWLWFFFRSVDVRHPERVPLAGPCSSASITPKLHATPCWSVAPSSASPLPGHPALFRQRAGRSLMRACGAIPVYRRQDDPDKMDQNASTFEACYQAFTDGRLIAIYPEGTTHAEVRVSGSRPAPRDWRSAGGSASRRVRLIRPGSTSTRAIVSGPRAGLVRRPDGGDAVLDAYRADPAKASPP